MYCKTCGKKINSGSKFCKNCGAKQEQSKSTKSYKNCPFCRQEISPDAKECPGCNRVLVEQNPFYKTTNHHETKESTTKTESVFYKLKKQIQRSDFLRKIRIKYLIVAVAVILVVWISNGADPYYSNSGAKSPLPTPTQQTLEEILDTQTKTSDISPSHGAIIKKVGTYFYGDGSLEISNGTNLDAVAKLIRSGTSVLTVYIRANSTYTISKISDGVYWLAFAQGTGWDSTTGQFLTNKQYSAFDSTFDFETTEDAEYEYYSTWEVTLNPIVGGNAETSNVDPTQFNAY